jgi:hypothetical protein
MFMPILLVTTGLLPKTHLEEHLKRRRVRCLLGVGERCCVAVWEQVYLLGLTCLAACISEREREMEHMRES